MKHITNQYGAETNLLELTLDEYEVLRAFLKKLGVRCRTTKWDSNGIAVIQAENPYKYWIGHAEGEKWANKDMSDESIKLYQR